MKNVIIGILLVATLGLGGLLIQKSNSLAESEAKLAAAQKLIAEAQANLAQAEKESARLGEKLEVTANESFSNANAANRLSHALTNRTEAEASTTTTNAKPANPFAAMFKNPEMRDMIKKQQKAVMGGMVDKNYAEFFKSMNLTPEQSETMKDLILNKMLGAADMGMEMMGGDMDAEKRAEMGKQMKEKSDGFNEQIKDMLGSENFTAYESYEKTIPDRTAISQFKSQLGDEIQMNGDQEKSLLAAMSEERQGFKFTTDYNDHSDFSEDMMSKFSEERMNVFFQEGEQLNQRYLTRAQKFLSPAQYTAYQKAIKSQQDMTQMGMKMAAQMFNTKK